MVKVFPYLNVENAKEAIKLYEKIFGAKLINHQPFSKEFCKKIGKPDDFDHENSTMIATIEIDGNMLYIADDIFGTAANNGRVEIVLHPKSKQQIDEMYIRAKDTNSKIIMELQKRPNGFYARFLDSMGIGWQLNFEE